MNLAVFYHCWLGEQDQGVNILAEQMHALDKSGLSAEAGSLFICGGSADVLLASVLCPAHTTLHSFGSSPQSEIPTMKFIQSWIKDFPQAMVCYFHTKGASSQGDPNANWRRRMEKHVIWNWRQCVKDLESGADAVGIHWLTPEQFPGMVTSPFFGGTFWWARAEYLRQLPDLPESSHSNRYEAESWIGRRRPYPKIVDYHPGWPSL